MRKPKVLIEIVQGTGGHSLYVNHYRVAGAKPLAGGRVVQEWIANRDDLVCAVQMPMPSPRGDEGGKGGGR